MKLGVVPNDPVVAYLKTYGKNFLIRYFNPIDYFNEVHIFSPYEKKDYNLSEKIKVHGLLWSSVRTSFNVLYYVFRTAILIKIYGIHIIRAYNPFLAGLVAVISGKLTRVPVVISIHTDYEQQRYMSKPPLFKWAILEFIEKFTLKNADRIVCISEHLRKKVVSTGISSEKIKVIPNRVETDLFSPEQDKLKIRNLLGIKDKRVVLSVGRLDKDRYPYMQYVLRSEVSVISRIPETMFVYVGDGDRRKDLVVLSKKLGIEEKTIFVGAQPRNQVAKFMAMADVVVCPMSGFVLLEAASSAKPIIALGIDWHSEVIKNKETGLLVNCGDAEGLEFRDATPLSEAILFLLSNPSLGEKFGTNARRIILKRFAWNILSQKEVDMYKQVISQK